MMNLTPAPLRAMLWVRREKEGAVSNDTEV
jgi:hypothetical protein